MLAAAGCLSSRTGKQRADFHGQQTTHVSCFWNVRLRLPVAHVCQVGRVLRTWQFFILADNVCNVSPTLGGLKGSVKGFLNFLLIIAEN